jgi:CMP-N,N'-diacetyllegionaminic acid synthase
MPYKGFSVLAVVPARGGSKSIPRKNMCLVGGISLVGRAAQVATSLSWVDKAILSTDDKEIKEEGLVHGLEVPFMRPKSLAKDLSSSVDMWRHAWITAEEHYNMRFDISILLEPTSPLRRPEDIEKTIAALLNGDHLAAATISKASAHFTPHKCLTINARGNVAFYLKDGAFYSIRQKIPRYYFRNGVCYAVKRETVVDMGQILEERCAAVVIERPLVNIDEPFDLELTEFLLKREQ